MTRADGQLTFYFRDTFQFFMVYISDGSLEIGRHGVGALPRVVEVLLRSARKIFWVLVLRCKAVATSETNESIRTATEAVRESAEVLSWCPGAEVVISNISMGCFPNPAPNVPLFSIGFYQHFPNRGDMIPKLGTQSPSIPNSPSRINAMIKRVLIRQAVYWHSGTLQALRPSMD